MAILEPVRRNIGEGCSFVEVLVNLLQESDIGVLLLTAREASKGAEVGGKESACKCLDHEYILFEIGSRFKMPYIFRELGRETS